MTKLAFRSEVARLAALARIGLADDELVQAESDRRAFVASLEDLRPRLVVAA